MLLLLLFGVIASIATVSGMAVDFYQDDYHVEGFLPNDLPMDSPGSNIPVDSTGNNIPVDNLAVDNHSDDLPTYGFPDDSNLDAFSSMRDKSDIGTFSPLPDEPTNDPAGQSLDSPTISLIGDSSIPDTLIPGDSNFADSEFDNSATLSSSCGRFFGLACCTGGSDQLSGVRSGESVPLQNIPGCSGRMCSYPLVTIRRLIPIT